MDAIKEKALCEFEWNADRKDPEYILEVRKNVLSVQKREQKRLGKKLKNPVHYRTGKPLNERTIQNYKASIEDTKEHLAALDLAIEKLNQYHLLGEGRKSINEVLASFQGKEIPKDEKPWIEALNRIKKTWGEREAYREKIFHILRTCQQNCPLKDLWKGLSYG